VLMKCVVAVICYTYLVVPQRQESRRDLKISSPCHTDKCVSVCCSVLL